MVFVCWYLLCEELGWLMCDGCCVKAVGVGMPEHKEKKHHTSEEM
jgi:hypothetical protein